MIRRITTFDPDQMGRLLAESQRESFRFLERLHEEWVSGANRFQKPGEALFGLFAEGEMVGVGGINRVDELTGRLRRFYILPSYRRRGCGRRLLRHILNHAVGHFQYVVLHTETTVGDRFYQACGLTRLPNSHDPTHQMTLPGAELFVGRQRSTF
jgi:GNAT superfamily N-acetyltransferase